MKYFWLKSGFTSFGIKYTVLSRVLEFWFDMKRIILMLKCITDTFLKWIRMCFMVDMLRYLRERVKNCHWKVKSAEEKVEK